MAASFPPAERPNCLNCGAEPSGAFCCACGQPAGLPVRSFGPFVHELLGGFFAFDGRVWRSLAPLFAHPGRLTRAWIEGRRASFVPPLRLFLFFTILLFLVVQCQANTTDLLVAEPTAEEPAAAAAEDPGFRSTLELPGFWPFSTLQARLDAQAEKLQHMDPRARNYVLAQRALELAPIGLLLLLPIMALFLKLWWARTGSYWLDHFVFLLHAYACFCGLLVLAALVPLPNGLFAIALGIGVPLYFYRAMRVVYRRGFWRSLLGTLIGGFLTAFGAVLVVILLAPYALLTV